MEGWEMGINLTADDAVLGQSSSYAEPFGTRVCPGVVLALFAPNLISKEEAEEEHRAANNAELENRNVLLKLFLPPRERSVEDVGHKGLEADVKVPKNSEKLVCVRRLGTRVVLEK